MSYKLPVKTVNLNINGDENSGAKLIENQVISNGTTKGEDAIEVSVEKVVSSKTTVDLDSDSELDGEDKHKSRKQRKAHAVHAS